MAYYEDEEFSGDNRRERKRKFVDYSKPSKTPKQALESLMLTCAKSERCVSDIKRALFRWRMEKEDYEPIIERLMIDRFVDEERYAMAYVRDKISCGSWGRRKIEQGLRVKGVPREIVEEALGQIEPEVQADKLETLVYRRFVREKDRAKSVYDLRTKLFRWAMGRGYDYDDVQDTLGRVMDADYDTEEEQQDDDF